MRIVPHVGPDKTREWSEAIALMSSDDYKLRRVDRAWRLELILSPEEMTVIYVPEEQIEELKKKPHMMRFEKDEAFLASRY